MATKIICPCGEYAALLRDHTGKTPKWRVYCSHCCKQGDSKVDAVNAIESWGKKFPVKKGGTP